MSMRGHLSPHPVHPGRPERMFFFLRTARRLPLRLCLLRHRCQHPCSRLLRHLSAPLFRPLRKRLIPLHGLSCRPMSRRRGLPHLLRRFPHRLPRSSPCRRRLRFLHRFPCRRKARILLLLPNRKKPRLPQRRICLFRLHRMLQRVRWDLLLQGFPVQPELMWRNLPAAFWEQNIPGQGRIPPPGLTAAALSGMFTVSLGMS